MLATSLSMFLKFVFLLGVVVMATADDGTLKALMEDLVRSAKDADMGGKHLTSDFEYGAIDKEMREKGFLRDMKDKEGVHAIATADSDLLALKEKGAALENPQFLAKLLKMAMGEDFKKEEFAEGDLKAALAYIAKVMESAVGDAFLKQEEFSKLFKDQHSAADASKMLKTEPEVLYASGGFLHDKVEDKDVKAHLKESAHLFKNGDIDLLKAIAELKAEKSMVPPFEASIPEDFLKSILHGEKTVSEETYSEILKSLEGLKSESLLYKDKLLAAKNAEAKDFPHPIALGKEHFLKDEIAKSHLAGEEDEEAFKSHKTFHEEAVDHKKDFMYDEILKHEEAHAYGEDLGIKESSEFDKELFPHSLLHELHKTKELGKDLTSEEIMKEKGLKVDEAKELDKAGSAKKEKSAEKGVKIGSAKDEGIKLESTHAYDKAKEQADKDAAIPFKEERKDGILFDETLKKILTDTKIEDGKIKPETKIYTEETLKKEKALVDGKEVSRKLFEEHDIAKGISHGIKVDEDIAKGIQHGIKAGTDIAKGIHYGIKTDEDIAKGIHHGIKVDEGIRHGIKVDEDIAKGIHHGIKVDEDFAKGIHHGIKTDEGISKGIHHGIKTDEGISKGIHHGIKLDEGISKGIHHGIKVDEGISKGIHHGIQADEGISKGIHHGIKVDEGISKGIHHGIKMDEEIAKGIKAADEHFVRSIDKHTIPLILKKKALEILSHILHMKKCHLVSMKPGELLSIVNCISRSKDPILCEKFAMCEKKMPPQVILALEMCQKELIPEKALRCSKYEPLYPSPDIPVKIFQCIVKNTRELLPEEKKQMIAFEECARQVKAESCGRIPWG